MKVATKFFGVTEWDDKAVIRFVKGIPGFETERSFILLKSEDSLFSCLQSVTDAQVAFVTVSPFEFCPDYGFDLDEVLTAKLKLTQLNEALILGVVTVPPGEPEKATLNLRAPMLINTQANLGCQVILHDSDYPLRFPIWRARSTAAVSG